MSEDYDEDWYEFEFEPEIAECECGFVDYECELCGFHGHDCPMEAYNDLGD